MNVPPTDGIRVAVNDLEELVVELFKAVPIPKDHARLIASKLVECDLRGVVSHGVLQVNRYVRSFQDGTVNPNPQIRVLKEGPTTAALSGDGGLGYLVATKAMAMAISKAQEVGIGATTSTYHAHLGSTGNYARMAMRADLIGISTSGRNAADHYNRDATIRGSIQGSPTFGLRHAGQSGQTNLSARLRQPLRDRRRDLPEVPAGFHQGHRHFARGQYPVGHAGAGRC